jgi:hypothetical protein
LCGHAQRARGLGDGAALGQQEQRLRSAPDTWVGVRFHQMMQFHLIQPYIRDFGFHGARLPSRWLSFTLSSVQNFCQSA